MIDQLVHWLIDSFIDDLLIDLRSHFLKQIVGGSLAFFYQSKEMANLSTASVSDGKWHNVKVRLDSKRIQLSQDYERHHVTKIHQVAMGEQACEDIVRWWRETIE